MVKKLYFPTMSTTRSIRSKTPIQSEPNKTEADNRIGQRHIFSEVECWIIGVGLEGIQNGGIVTVLLDIITKGLN